MRPPWWESNEIKHGQTCQAVVNCKWWKYQSNPWEDVHKSPAWDKYENIEIMRTPLWESNEIKHGQTCQAVVNCKWWKYQSSPWEDVHQQYATLEIKRCKEIDRAKLIVHREQRQSSKAFIKAAQSENKKSENKKVKNRKEGKGSSTARKYCNSCCLDNSFKSKILGKSWQIFPGTTTTSDSQKQ